MHAQIQRQGGVGPLPYQGGEGDGPVHGHSLGAVNDGVSGLPTGHLAEASSANSAPVSEMKLIERGRSESSSTGTPASTMGDMCLASARTWLSPRFRGRTWWRNAAAHKTHSGLTTRHCQVGAAGGGHLAGRFSHPNHVHAHIRAALYNTVKSGLIHLGLINNHHHVGHMQGVCFFEPWG